MRMTVLCLIAVFAAGPAFAEEEPSRGKVFWSGLALGIAGITTSALGVTVYPASFATRQGAPPSSY